MAQDFNQQSFIEVSVNLGCYLIDSQEYIPLQGNFDTDAQLELLWYSPTDNVHVLWHDIDGMLSGFALPCEPYASMYSISSVTTEDVEAAKPSVGDFNGDRIDDVFWYLPGQSLVSLFGPGEPLEVLHISMFAPVDATPIVGDFNGDKCEDILWYLPHPSGAIGTRGQSPVWRSLCDGNFVEEVSSVSTPGQAYPIGYNPRRGRGL